MIKPRVYDDSHGEPVAILVVTGVPDVNHLANILTFPGAQPIRAQVDAGQHIIGQVMLSAAFGGRGLRPPTINADRLRRRIASLPELFPDGRRQWVHVPIEEARAVLDELDEIRGRLS